MRARHSLLALALVAAAAGAGAWEVIVGFPRTFEGVRVHRVTGWYAWGLGLPIPYMRGLMYWAYTDKDGQEVRHGFYRRFHGNRQLGHAVVYRHGQLDGTATTWDHHGGKTDEHFYRRGALVGWAIFDGHRLHYLHEAIFEGERRIGYRAFEGGRFRLSFFCGELIDRLIDPVTGEVRRLDQPAGRACE